MRGKKLLVLVVCLYLLITGISGTSALGAQRTKITYWTIWTGFEFDTIKELVDEFNASQNKIEVDVLPVSGLGEKLLVAVAAGEPPDVTAIGERNIAPYAIRNGVIPLDRYIKKAGISRDSYISIAYDMLSYKGHQWALPITLMSCALHWNKGMFKKAGLDPNNPPRTIKELDTYNEKLTRWDSAGNIIQMGFDPAWPGWWPFAWVWYFGGKLYDPQKKKVTADNPQNVKAFEWVQSYAKKFGAEALQTFASGFGTYSGPTNPFFAEKLAMVYQGSWHANFIQKFAPDMEFGVAAFPYGPGGAPDTARVTVDALAIPRGAKHPDEAFEFIKWMSTQYALEKLALGHRKMSPLKASYNAQFIAKHPNPYIEVFYRLTFSPNARHELVMPVWDIYRKEMAVAFDSVMLLKETPQEALRRVTFRVQRELDRVLAKYKL